MRGILFVQQLDADMLKRYALYYLSKKMMYQKDMLSNYNYLPKLVCYSDLMKNLYISHAHEEQLSVIVQENFKRAKGRKFPRCSITC
jgi:hypothetical protein